MSLTFTRLVRISLILLLAGLIIGALAGLAGALIPNISPESFGPVSGASAGVIYWQSGWRNHRTGTHYKGIPSSRIPFVGDSRNCYWNGNHPGIMV